MINPHRIHMCSVLFGPENGYERNTTNTEENKTKKQGRQQLKKGSRLTTTYEKF
jgi:hypothetical protein